MARGGDRRLNWMTPHPKIFLTQANQTCQFQKIGFRGAVWATIQRRSWHNPDAGSFRVPAKGIPNSFGKRKIDPTTLSTAVLFQPDLVFSVGILVILKCTDRTTFHIREHLSKPGFGRENRHRRFQKIDFCLKYFGQFWIPFWFFC